jgi:Predicted butyrate kinase
MTEDDIGKMIPLDTQVAVNEGIKNILLEMKQKKMPVCFTPGVIHLKTVPSYRKWNKFDMGTADKVCCVALGIKSQAERLGIPFDKTSFVHVEVGYGFTAVIAVEDGKIIDGIGGTNGSMGFLACGGLDAEIAIRLKPPVTQDIVFKGGLKDFVGKDIEPKELINFKEAVFLLGESIEKDVASILVTMHNPKEIILSGRLMPLDFIRSELAQRLSKYALVAKVKNLSKIAKEAACGAYVIGEGLLGGRYQELVENMGILNIMG